VLDVSRSSVHRLLQSQLQKAGTLSSNDEKGTVSSPKLWEIPNSDIPSSNLDESKTTDRVIDKDSKLYTLVKDQRLIDHFDWFAVKRFGLVYPFRGNRYVLNDSLHEANEVDIDRCPACKLFADEPRLDDNGKHIGNWLGPDPLDYGNRYPHSHKYSFKHGND
jgi:hypothetical protein